MTPKISQAAAIALLTAAIVTAPFAGPLAQTEDAPDMLRPVRLAVVEPPETTVTRAFYGEVVALQTVDLAFQVGGQLQKLPVRNGQEVAKGDLLAQLDLDPFERAVERAELNLSQAQRDFDRSRQLAQSNVASEVRADDAQTALSLAEVELREARDALENATLSAEFDGLVAQRLVANFTTVAQGTPVLRLHDMSQPRIEIDVPERLFARAGPPENITFMADLGDGLAGIPLTLAEFTAETVGISQSYTVDLALPEVDGHSPIPGQTATVNVTVARGQSETLGIPPTALLTTADRGTEVMVFEPAGADTGSVRAVPVTVTSREGGALAIRQGDALKPGMEIVTTGAHLLTEGQRVRRFTGFSEER